MPTHKQKLDGGTNTPIQERNLDTKLPHQQPQMKHAIQEHNFDTELYNSLSQLTEKRRSGTYNQYALIRAKYRYEMYQQTNTITHRNRPFITDQHSTPITTEIAHPAYTA